ncbi:MAG: hypothetical protein VX874_05390 [Pseudomonadota bacterium]|nr:hypothetical protein [Pseudomonadota bacterium]
MRILTAALFVPASFALSGCLVSTQDLIGASFSASDSIAGFDSGAMSGTLPATGTATYSGFSRIISYSTNNGNVADVFLGTASLTASVDASGADLDGTLTDFAVAEDLPYSDYTDFQNRYSPNNTVAERNALIDDVAAVSGVATGSIAVTASNQTNADNMTARFSGELDHGGNTTRIGGFGAAGFFGANHEYISAYGDTSSQLTVSRNGVARSGSAEFIVGK